MLASAIIIFLVGSGGLAYAAFPSVSPAKSGEISIAANPQKVAVDLTDDTAYVVGTGPGVIVAANPALDDTLRASAGVQPTGVAVDSDDDTIYVTDRNTPGKLLVFTPSLALARQVSVYRQPQGVAVHPLDDTVYVTFPMDDSLSILNGRNLDDSVTVRVGDEPYDVAVNPTDDTIYTANYNGKTVSAVNPKTLAVTTVSLAAIGSGVSPLAVAVHPTDDTVYTGGQGQRGLVVMSPDLATRTLVPLNGSFAEVRDISISPDGSTIYLATDSNLNHSIALKATNLDDSYRFEIGQGPAGVAATNWGAYFALNGSGKLAVASVPPTVTAVAPASGPTQGGTTITITGTGFVSGQTTATIGGAPLLNIAVVNATTLTATTPAASEGAAAVAVNVGLLSASLAGAFTFVPPPPPVPSTQPLDVAADAGDASALVTWKAPLSPGSFPISHYQAIASPGGRMCLTSGLSCTVDGLANGTTYTFTVKALTGAGWSTESEPSNAVTPSVRSIVIRGSREGRRVVVSGVTAGFETGAIVSPWVRLSASGEFSRGAVTVTVSSDGTFSWARLVSPGRTLSVYFEGDGVRSNVVVVR